MTTLLIFLLILSILVLIHELGHFVAAKAAGVRVEEFGWGLPPRIIGKKFGETTYSINLLPFGGFVKLTGEDLEQGQEDTDDLGKRIGTVISGIQPGSPAEKAGLTLGEAVLAVNDRKVTDITQFKNVLAEYNGQPVKLTLTDLKDTTYTKVRDVQVSPTKYEGGKPIIGVYLGESVSISYKKPLDRILVGFYHSYNVMGYSMNTLGQMVSISFKTKDLAPVSESVSGPVGIYNLVDMVLKYGGPNAWLTLFDYTALMSLSLAVVNIIPFPALDGGRVAFVLFEGITRKKPNPKMEAAFHRLGMVFLLGFLILITIRDVTR